MEIIVCKFGGTSTASADLFRQILRILRADPARRYVVLSAPGGPAKVTDLIARYRATGDEGALEAAAARYRDIAAGLGLPDPSPAARQAIAGAQSDMEAASRGEYLCARLFAEWSALPFVDAAGVIRFAADGSLDPGATRTAVQAMARRCPRAVIPGFYGSLPDGRVATLPRNGSDITGALIAASLGADLYENWTDVPGLMTADPAVHPDARVIPRISYAQMRRLAESGARVLHPDSLGPVAAAGIPTRIRPTLAPDAPGTLVTDSA